MQIFPPFHCWEPTTWPANDCLQIMVCSCTMSSNSVRLQIIFWFLLMPKWNNAFLFLAIALEWKWQIALQIIKKQSQWSNNKTIIELGYRKISLFVQCLVYQLFSLQALYEPSEGNVASCAKRETSAKRETRGGEKNKAPVTSPLLWLFRPHLSPQILTDDGFVKRTNEKLKTRSITHFFWLPETPTAA